VFSSTFRQLSKCQNDVRQRGARDSLRMRQRRATSHPGSSALSRTIARASRTRAQPGSDFAELFEVRSQHFAFQGQVHELALALNIDQARGRQFFEMVRQGRRRDALCFVQVGTSHRFVRRTNLFQDLKASRLCQGARDARHFMFRKLETLGTRHSLLIRRLGLKASRSAG